MSAHSHDRAAVAPVEVLDPVCGMTISPDDAVGHVEHKGHSDHFCSQSCLDQFAAERYRRAAPAQICREPGERQRTSAGVSNRCRRA